MHAKQIQNEFDERIKLLYWVANQANKRWYLHQPKQVHQGSIKEIWDETCQISRHAHENINQTSYA